MNRPMVVYKTSDDNQDTKVDDNVVIDVIGISGFLVTESMDDCGLRFMLAMRHHIYLVRTLPPRQRVMLRQQGLKMFNIVWAFHSEATEVVHHPDVPFSSGIHGVLLGALLACKLP